MGALARKEVFGVLNSESFQNQLAAALPKIMPLEKFTRSIITQVNKTPKLLTCSQESLFSSVIALAGAGLEADGYNAHILPYGNTATPIVDYKGMVELMYRSGQVAAVNGYAVYENDDFEFNLGEVTRHSFDIKKDRGEIVGAFTVVRMKGGEKSFHFMTKNEIDEIGKTSPAFNSKFSPWVKHYKAMAIKTVLRQHSKWVPLSSEAKDIIMKEIEVEVQTANNAKQAVTMASLVGEEAQDEGPKETDIEVKAEKQAKPEQIDDLGDEFEKATK